MAAVARLKGASHLGEEGWAEGWLTPTMRYSTPPGKISTRRRQFPKWRKPCPQRLTFLMRRVMPSVGPLLAPVR